MIVDDRIIIIAYHEKIVRVIKANLAAHGENLILN